MNGERTVFVVEDDRKIAGVLVDYLRSAGYEVRLFPDGRGVVAAAREISPAAVVLDLTLPVGDGMSICSALREFSTVPILMLTARVELNNRVTGLALGADDYVSKPFSAAEVVARVGALIRRAEGRLTRDPASVSFMIDADRQRIAWHGKWLELSTFEFRILAAMMRQPGRVFSRMQLLDEIGTAAQESGDRAIDTHIKNIRRKIAAVDPDADCVTAVYGSGYRFEGTS
jgi:two-component system, OmpR family, response regulator BaeR